MMHQEHAWEDEETNRRVALAVSYRRHGDEVKVLSVTPRRVTFVCPDTKTELRTIGVHTDKGRQLLSEQFLSRVGVDRLHAEILDRDAAPAGV